MANEHKTNAVSPLATPLQPPPTPQNPTPKLIDLQEGLAYINRNLWFSSAEKNKQLLETVQYLDVALRNAVACIKTNLTLTISAYVQELTKRLDLLNTNWVPGIEVKVDNDGEEQNVPPQQIIEETYLINLEKIAGKQALFSSSPGKTLLACVFFIDPHLISFTALEKCLHSKAFSKDIAILKSYGLLEETESDTLFVNPLLKTLIIHRDLIPEDLSTHKKTWINFLLKTAETRFAGPHTQATNTTPPPSPEIRLVQAAMTGQLEIVQLLLAAGVNITASKNLAYTPLALAAENKHLAVTQCLLTADQKSERPQLQALIHYAFNSGHLTIASSLIAFCPDSYLPQLRTQLKPHIEPLTPCLPSTPSDRKSLVKEYFRRMDHHQFLTTPLPKALIELIQSYLLPYGANEYATRSDKTLLNAPASAFSPAPFLGRAQQTNLFLFYAVQNDISTVKTILEKDRAYVLEAGKVHAPSGECFFHATALSCALYLQLWEMAAVILSALPLEEAKKQLKTHEQEGVRPYGQDKDNTPPLISAIKKNQPTLVLQLLQCGANPNVKEEKSEDTPLSLAIRNNDLSLTKLLLEAGVDKEAKNKDGDTPLLLATYNGHLEVVRLLLQSGASIEAKGEKNLTLLEWAIKRNQSASAILFRKHTAQLAAQLAAQLLEATKRGQLEEVQTLLMIGADKEAKNRHGDTPLVLAAYKGHLKVVRLLLRAGANLEAKGAKNLTALEWAVKAKKADCAALLREYAAQLATQLLEAAKNGQLEEMRSLLATGADKEARSRGYTPLTSAAINGHLEAVRLLLNAGANTESKTQWGDTPLTLAAAYGYLEAVRLLLDRGADNEAKNQWGDTPLIWAASKGHLEVVRLLLDAGANKKAKNQNGRTPLTSASAAGHLVVVRLLQPHTSYHSPAPPPSQTSNSVSVKNVRETKCEENLFANEPSSALFWTGPFRKPSLAAPSSQPLPQQVQVQTQPQSQSAPTPADLQPPSKPSAGAKREEESIMPISITRHSSKPDHAVVVFSDPLHKTLFADWAWYQPIEERVNIIFLDISVGKYYTLCATMTIAALEKIATIKDPLAGKLQAMMDSAGLGVIGKLGVVPAAKQPLIAPRPRGGGFRYARDDGMMVRRLERAVAAAEAERLEATSNSSDGTLPDYYVTTTLEATSDSSDGTLPDYYMTTTPEAISDYSDGTLPDTLESTSDFSDSEICCV